MPQLPDRQRSGFLQTEVPRATGPVTAQGANYDALAQLGGQISNIALDLQQKRTQAEEQQFLTNMDTQDLLATKKFMQEAKLNAPADGSGYTKSVEEFVNSRLEENLAQAPSDRAREAYRRNASNFFTRSLVDADAYEQEMRVKKMDADMSANVDAYARTQLDLPNPEESVERMAKFDTDYQGYVGTVYDQATADKLKLQAKNTVSKSTLEGLYNRGNLQAGIKLLKPLPDGTESPFSAALSPKEKDAFLEKFNRKAAADKEIAIGTINKRIQDISARALKKFDVPPEEFDKAVSMVNRATYLGASRQAELRDDILSTKAVSVAIGMAKGMNNTQLVQSKGDIENFIKKYTPEASGFFNAAKKLELEAKYVNAVDEMLKRRESNGVESSIEYDSTAKQLASQAESAQDPMAMQKFLEHSKQVQLQMGIRPDKVRVTTDAKIEQMAFALNTATNPDDVSNKLEHYEQQFGPDFRKAIMEAAAEDKKAISVEYVGVVNLVNTTDRKQAINNIRDKDKILDRFKAVDGIKNEDITRATNEALQPMINAMGGVPKHYDDGFLSTASLEMKRLVSSGMSLSDAKKSITKTYFENNFELAQTRTNTVTIPKNQGYRKDYIESFLDVYTPKHMNGYFWEDTVKKATEFGVVPSQAYMSDSIAKGKTEQQAKDEFYHRFRAYGKWVTAPDMNGVVLVLGEPTGTSLVLDANGRSIYKSYQEISTTGDERVLRNMRSPLKKFGDLLGF